MPHTTPHWSKNWKQKRSIDRFRIVFIVLMQIAFAIASVIAIFEKEWLTLFVCITALIVAWLPSILERNLHVHFPLEFDFLLNIFIYSSLFLGEVRGYYTRFWWWDIVLHASSGIALGFIGFLILYSLYRSKRLEMNPSLLAVFSFCFALALGVLWEIFEYTMDSTFGFNMQKSGLRDTMWDIIVNTVGAFIASLSGYLYVRYRWRGTGILEHHLNVYFSSKELNK
ncbi:MAG: hypothetical protein WDZ88_00260 [Candidatus Paceibacterota bacterium]